MMKSFDSNILLEATGFGVGPDTNVPENRAAVTLKISHQDNRPGSNVSQEDTHGTLVCLIIGKNCSATQDNQCLIIP
jgi:hypothetical protein